MLKTTRTPLALAIFSLISTAAFAETKAPAEIEEVLVIAQREPGNVTLNSDDIARTQASTLEGLLSNESSIAVGGGSATAQKIYVRGFEDVMLNVTIDGAQAPGELYHHQGRVQVEPEFIKTLELDAGAGAATNGPGALTGALKVSLKEADDMLKPGQKFGALLKGTAISNGDDGSKGTASVYGKLSDNVGIIAGYTHEKRDEYADGNGDITVATPYDHAHGFVKLNGAAADHTFSLTLENLDDTATTFERPNFINFNGRYLVSDQATSRNTVAINERYNPDSELIDIQATVFRNDSDFSVQRQSSAIIYGEGDFVSTGFDLHNSASFGDHKLTFGTDYRGDKLESAQNATPPPFWGTTEQQAAVNGTYIQDNWTPVKSVLVSGGLRYDAYSFDVKQGVSKNIAMDDSGASPNLSIDWEPLDGLVLRTAYAQAFRGVNIREAFFSALYRHDGTLKSETADNLEFGISYDWDNVFVRTTTYKQNIENFTDIVYGAVNGDGAWGYWRNIGDAEVKGYELETGIHLEHLNASIGVWNADNKLNGQPLNDANMGLGTSIGRTWIAKVDYHFTDLRLSIGTDIRHVESEKNTVSTTAPDKKAYTAVKAFANWQATSDLSLALTANNLLDEFYYDHATYTYVASAGKYAGLPSVGREIVASVSYKF